MEIIHICSPKYHAITWIYEGIKWYMDWLDYGGPQFSRDNFQDGGVELNEVPEQIKKNAEGWAKAVLGKDVYISEDTGCGCKK